MNYTNYPIRMMAHYYYSFGFNVTCIGAVENDYNYFNASLLKAPTHSWEHLISSRQSTEEFTSYEWENSSGIGCVVGSNDIRCIDVDGVSDFGIIKDFLSILNLPKNYEWVTLTGSGNGFHIYIRADQHPFVINNGQTKGFYSDNNWKSQFKILELRWKYHCVLPTSLHKSNEKYIFRNGKLPKNVPQYVKMNSIEALIYLRCQHKLEIYKGDLSKIYFLETNNKGLYTERIDKSKLVERKFLVFDTETNGLPKNWKKVPDSSDNWPRLIQIAWYVFGENANFIEKRKYLIKPEGFEIQPIVTELTGVTQHEALTQGRELKEVLLSFLEAIDNVDFIVAHNLQFDQNVILSECFRLNLEQTFTSEKRKLICTMKSSIDFCALADSKFPKLSELYEKLFNDVTNIQHNAMSDAKITAKCFWELLWREVITLPPIEALKGK
ncbi:MAG: exonuclease domain-containing protein [bacterium]|nr:exonuclease domain-containing protein [bacterium]